MNSQQKNMLQVSMKAANASDKKMLIFAGKANVKDAEYKNKAIVRINS